MQYLIKWHGGTNTEAALALTTQVTTRTLMYTTKFSVLCMRLEQGPAPHFTAMDIPYLLKLCCRIQFGSTTTQSVWHEAPLGYWQFCPIVKLNCLERLELNTALLSWSQPQHGWTQCAKPLISNDKHLTAGRPMASTAAGSETSTAKPLTAIRCLGKSWKQKEFLENN